MRYLKTLNQSNSSIIKIFIFGLFLLFGVSGLSQTQSVEYKISGQIIDKKSNDSIALCVVEIFDEYQNRIGFTKSDFFGSFNFKLCSNLISEKTNIKLTAVGYYPKTFQLKIENNMFYTFTLKRDLQSKITLDSLNELTTIGCGDYYSYILNKKTKSNLYKHYCTGNIKTLEEIDADGNGNNFRDWILLDLDSLSKCDKAQIRAIWDAKSGNYVSMSYGLMNLSPEDWYYYKFKSDYARQNYNVFIGNGGCVVTQEAMCYSGKMHELIYRDFGDSIFLRIDKEAKLAYKERLQNLSDTAYVFEWTIVDEVPSFIPDMDSFSSYIKRNVVLNNKINHTVFLSFIVEKDGSITDIEIIKGGDKEADLEIIKVLKAMPNWSPGILNGQKVRTKVLIPIKFN